MTAECLVSIMLLEDSTPRQVFNEFLLSRTVSILVEQLLQLLNVSKNINDDLIAKYNTNIFINLRLLAKSCFLLVLVVKRIFHDLPGKISFKKIINYIIEDSRH